MSTTTTEARVVEHDLTPLLYTSALDAGCVAWDIETTGLDWSKDQIGTCQIATEESTVVVLLRPDDEPKYLAALLEEPTVRKVFHHAPFDLRFMRYRWDVRPANVVCTKVAVKILEPHLERSAYSLQPVLERHLGVHISKQEQVSDWLAPHLTEAQLDYAVTDVKYLIQLYRLLESRCRAIGILDELEASMAYLPTRVALDLEGSGDVFAY